MDGEDFLDKGTQQRILDTKTINSESSINKDEIKNEFIEDSFNEGDN